MKYIPLVALLLCQTIAIGAEELPAFEAQVTPYNAPRIILAQEDEDPEVDDAEVDDNPLDLGAECEDNTSQAECEEAKGCTWIEADEEEEEDECVGDE